MFTKNRILFVCFLSCLAFNCVFAEVNSFYANKSISLSYTFGFIPDKNYEYQHLLNGYVRSVHINLCNSTSGNKYWHKYYKYPETGFNIFFYELSNKPQLGILTGIIPYIQFQPANNKRIYPFIKFGIGLTYATKIFDKFNNVHNTFLGSHLNAAINADFGIQIKFAQKISIYTGASFIHFSNGNTKLPNNGINVVSSKTGIYYRFNERVINNDRTILPAIKQFEFNISGSVALVNRRNTIDYGYICYDLMAEATKSISPVYSAGLGIDYGYNTSDTTGIIDIEIKHLPIVNHQLGLKAINTFKFSRLEFLFQFGVDLFGNKWVYDWIIFRYKIYKGLKLNLSYKSYLLRGDHLGWGITYEF